MQRFTAEEIAMLDFEDMPDFDPSDEVELSELSELYLLHEAHSHLLSALAALRQYVSITGDRYTETYIVDKLTILTTNDHGFLTRDPSVAQLIDDVSQRDAAADWEARTLATCR